MKISLGVASGFSFRSHVHAAQAKEHAETASLAEHLSGLLGEERASAADVADGLRDLLQETNSKLQAKLETLEVDLDASQARGYARAHDK